MDTGVKKRISLVLPAMPRGGAEGQVYELLGRLDHTRFIPELVLLQGDCEFPITGLTETVVLNVPVGIQFTQLRQRLASVASAIVRLARHYRVTRPAVVHAFLPPAALIGICAARLANVPVRIVSRRSMLDLYRHSLLAKAVDRLALRLGTAFIGNCEAITREAIVVDRMPSNRVFKIHNGVDCDRFLPGRDLQFRRSLGFADTDVVLGTVGNLRSCKRHADFVHAAATVQTRCPHAKFLIVGKDQGALRTIQSLISDYGLESSFVIVGGTAEPQSFYRAMDIYVCTSSTEGLSNSILEAMASGKPVIATSVGGNAELVRHSYDGYLIPPRNPGMLATAALTLISQAVLRREFGQRSRDAAEQYFSINAMVHRHELLYTRLLGLAETRGTFYPAYESSSCVSQ